MASKNEKLTLTSVKVHQDLFEEFKVASIKNKFNLQKLTNRAIHLYLSDDEFRKQLHNHTELVMSGSL
jgi:hypothetical protein